MSKTILIIGANSAAAKEIMPVLAKEHAIITAGKKGCDVYCDVTEPIELPYAIDVVINFAASFGGDTDEEIQAAVHTNVLGTLNICQAAKASGVQQVVLISSIFTLLDETSPSYSIYAVTKKLADELAEFYCKLNKLPLTILRPSRLYGDSDTFEKNQPFLYHMINKAQVGDDIYIYGKNDAERNYLHVADLAEVINQVIDQGVTGIYPCTYPSNVTYSQIAHAGQKVFRLGGKVEFLEENPDIPNDTFPLDQSIYEKIEYRPGISIEDGITRIKNHRAKEKS